MTQRQSKGVAELVRVAPSVRGSALGTHTGIRSAATLVSSNESQWSDGGRRQDGRVSYFLANGTVFFGAGRL